MECLLFLVRCLLSVVCCLLFIALFPVCCYACGLRFVVCRVLVNVCLLCIVCCVLSAPCYCLVDCFGCLLFADC